MTLATNNIPQTAKYISVMFSQLLCIYLQKDRMMALTNI